jgi:hypothetical protein
VEKGFIARDDLPVAESAHRITEGTPQEHEEMLARERFELEDLRPGNEGTV